MPSNSGFSPFELYEERWNETTESKSVTSGHPDLATCSETYIHIPTYTDGDRGSTVVEVLCYKTTVLPRSPVNRTKRMYIFLAQHICT